MAKTISAINAGVNAANGFEFQKHCALYILFEQYHQIKDQTYFICLEHHEDFLIAHINQTGNIKSIQAFQAKKATTDWAMSKELYELVNKIAETGTDLIADPIPKEQSYSHTLHFLSNRSIKLNNGKKKPNSKSVTINLGNHEANFSALDLEISDKVISQLKTTFSISQTSIYELQKMSFKFVDLPQAMDKQKSTLIGEFAGIFGSSVTDHKAAIDTILLLFRDVENTLNSKNIIKLLDNSKRVTSDQINKALNIITKQKKAYDLWRSKGDSIAELLNIPAIAKKKFEADFINSFDLFKDLQQVEHQTIHNYVKNNVPLVDTLPTDAECINMFYNSYKTTIGTQLGDRELKAAIYAAYIELLESL